MDSTVAELKPAKALAHAKRAASLATAGKFSESEKDLKEAETLGSSDSQLTPIRQLLAQAYVKQAEAAAQSGNTAQVVASASKAVEYDESIVIPPAVLLVLADESVKQLEQSSSDANRDVALAVIAKLSESGENSSGIATYRQRIGVILLRRAQATITSDLSAALSDYIAAIDLGVPASDSQALRDQLVTALTARCRQSLGSQDAAKASADYAAVAKLDSQAASLLVADFEKLPASVLSQLPTSVLSQLPASVRLQSPPRKNSIGIEFKLLPAGTFTMGDKDDAHRVTLTKAFELGVYEVTQKQYEQVMGTNPSNFKGAQNPVDNVSWHDAVEFCRKLSALPAEQAAGRVYRLPTEAEWEYACRGGTTTLYSFGDDESQLGQYAWYDKNSGNTTHAVGGKKPNPWGLYDMHGNVAEWVEDEYGEYQGKPAIDPSVPNAPSSAGSQRVFRGGYWFHSASSCRAASRFAFLPASRFNFIGFRVSLVAGVSRVSRP